MDQDGIKFILFDQSLDREERRWFTSLPYSSISGYPALEDTFKERWKEKKDSRRFLSHFYFTRREENESVQEFSDRFMKIYNAIPYDFKPPPGVAQL